MIVWALRKKEFIVSFCKRRKGYTVDDGKKAHQEKKPLEATKTFLSRGREPDRRPRACERGSKAIKKEGELSRETSLLLTKRPLCTEKEKVIVLKYPRKKAPERKKSHCSAGRLKSHLRDEKRSIRELRRFSM